MEYTPERSISMASAGGFRTPGQLAGDVDKRDRDWENWERDCIQSVVNQLGEILTKNYPGQGWLQISLNGNRNSFGHDRIVFTAFQSAFGKNLIGLRKAVEELFPTAQWRVVSKMSSESSIMYFFFQPLHVPLRLFERWFGWVREVSSIDATLDCTNIAAPPTSLRPNHRSVKDSSAEGVSVGSMGNSKATAPAFAYENLC